MDAATPIDKFNTAKRVQRRLRKDPHDIEALLQLADLLGALTNPDLKEKRKVLQHILLLEPANPDARQMLFEMDRAAIGGDPSRLSAAVMLTEPVTSPIAEKPLRLRYSIIHQFLVYVLFAFTTFLTWNSIQKPEVLAVFAAFLLFLLIPVWFVSVVIEIGDSELNISRLFGVVRSEIPWNEIEEFRSSPMGQGIKIITREGKVAEISAQIMGYSSVIEILRQKRPDLFKIINNFRPEMGFPDEAAVPLVRANTFQKTTLAKYGPLFALILGLLIFLGSAITLQCLVIIPMGLFVFLLGRVALYTPYLIRIEENKFFIESFRTKFELAPQQIKDIRMNSTYNYKYGWARQHIQVSLVDGSSFRLSGFTEGNEILYGFLKNWWNAYQTP